MQPGTVIAGKYRLARRLGQGAMGVVWAATNEFTERQVALKLIPKWGEENEEVRRRLLREARACGRLNHRNVVEIYDVGQTDEGEPFLVMQLLSGETLAELMKRERKLTQSFAAFIALEVTRALTAAHAAGIIHRDLKPPNVYLHKEPDGEGLTVKVLDFGVSKILASHDGSKTETGSAIGSPAYMSPEQAKGDRYVDHRTDIWALGVLLFEMLTGRRPFLGETMFTVVADILGGPIPLVSDVAPEVDPGLVQIVARCIERDVRKRVASAEELVALLRPFVAGRSSPLDSSPFSRAFATGSYPNAEKVLAAGHASDPSLQPGSGPRSAVPQSAPGGQRRPTFQPVHQPPPPPPQQAGPAYPQNSPQGATPHAPAQAAYAQSTPQALPQPQPQRPQQSGHGQPVAYPASPRPQQPSAVQKAPAAGPGPLRTTLRMDHALQPTEPVKRSAMPSVSDAPTAPGQQLPKNQVAPIPTPAPPPVHAPEPPPPPQSAIASAPPSSATTSPVAEGEATGKPQLLEEDDSEISNALTSVRMSRPEIPSQPGASLSKPPPAPPLSFGAPIDTLSSALASSAPISAPVPPPASTPPSGSALGSLSALANLSVDSSVLPSPLSTTSPITASSTSASMSSSAAEIEAEPSIVTPPVNARKRKLVVMAAALGGAAAMILVLFGVKGGEGDAANPKPITLEGISPRHNAIAAAARSAATKALTARSTEATPPQDVPTVAADPSAKSPEPSPSATATATSSPRPVAPPRYTPRKKKGGGVPDDPG